jgi:hypothetical protein
VCSALLGLLGYVANQWPKPVEELSIPPGKVQAMPGGVGIGICVQGDPNGLSFWYLVKTNIIRTNSLSFYDK